MKTTAKAVLENVLAKNPGFEVTRQDLDTWRPWASLKNGTGQTVEIEVEEERTQYCFRSRETGIFRVYVRPTGAISQDRSYVKMDGGEKDAAKVTKFWSEKVNGAFGLAKVRQEAEVKQVSRQASVEGAVKALRQQFELGDYARCVGSGRDWKWPSITVAFNHLTQEQAAAILSAAKTAGVKLD